jgi:pyruvate,water dikinase
VSGGVGLSLGNISSVVMGGMMASASSVGGDSYALVAHDYMNLSAKFGYHFANIDSMCTDEAEQNHIIVQFSGGVGSFTGKACASTSSEP